MHTPVPPSVLIADHTERQLTRSLLYETMCGITQSVIYVVLLWFQSWRLRFVHQQAAVLCLLSPMWSGELAEQVSVTSLYSRTSISASGWVTKVGGTVCVCVCVCVCAHGMCVCLCVHVCVYMWMCVQTKRQQQSYLIHHCTEACMKFYKAVPTKRYIYGTWADTCTNRWHRSQNILQT